MLQVDRVVSLCADSFCIFKRIADLHTFDGLHGHDRHGKFCFEAFIPLDETAETNGKIERDNFQHAAQSVFAVNGLFDFITHLLRR